jgi:hypothetical protein
MIATRDRMLVCRSGHLITDRLTIHPELNTSRCDRCGADTLDRCDTCGTLFAGAMPSFGLDPIGSRPPAVCSTCGSPFPWAKLADPEGNDLLSQLEHLLRRLPRVMHELRPAPDLDTLVRAMLHVHFDDVRPQKRTPLYSTGNCVAFRLPEIEAVVVAHRVGLGVGESELSVRWEEDMEEFPNRTLIFFVFDPERRLPERLEAIWSREDGKRVVRAVVAG